MTIETKFDFGQRVYRIWYAEEEYTEKCSFCEGKGYIIYKEKQIECTESGCWGKGHITKSKTKQWFVPKDEYQSFVIQKIVAEYHNPNNKKWENCRNWTYYMESGHGGMMINENDCFSSIKEAEEECTKRNKQ